MSADNWTACPRCTERRQREVDAYEAKVREAYGTVDVDEFDEMRAKLAAMYAKLEEPEQTFGEHYEFYGAGSGTLHVSYSGECQRCGLSVSIEQDHTIWPES